MKKVLLAISLLWFAGWNAQSQVVRPLYIDAPRDKASVQKVKQQKKLVLSDTLFFDDFARFDDQFDTAWWVTGSDAYVNNRFGMNAPSKNVATFDGLKANGQPHSWTGGANPPVSTTDVLTSKPINLSGFLPSDSVYLSFYYQAGGYGDPPFQTSKKFYLELKNNNLWVPILSLGHPNRDLGNFPPASVSSRFKLITFRIPSQYLDPDFQFRFRATGWASGAGDVWNLDYVYLNNARTVNDTSFYDVTTVSSPTPFLEKYTAMPLRQFFANPAASQADSMCTTVRNLHDVFRIINHYGLLCVSNPPNNPAEVCDTLYRSLTTPAYEADSMPQARCIPTQNNLVFQPQNGPLVIRHQFSLTKNASENILTRYNDSISRTTVLSNYYAYDDGTAELFIGFPAGSGQPAQSAMACRFDLNQPDTLKGGLFYFTPSRFNFTGRTIIMTAWGMGADSLPDLNNVLGTQTITIGYDSLNEYRYYTFPGYIPVSGSFFLGWTQTYTATPQTLDAVFPQLGYDKNEVAEGVIYRRIGVNSNNLWSLWDQDPFYSPGSLMMRPVMGGPHILNTPPPVAARSFIVSPNPSTGIFSFNGDCQQLNVFDLNGRQIDLKGRFNQNSLTLQGLPAGVYVLQVLHQGKLITRKLILTSN